MELLDVLCRLGAVERRHCGLICDLGEETLKDHLIRLERAGHVRKQQLIGNQILAPTHKGRIAAKRPGERVTEWELRHTVEVARTLAWALTDSFARTVLNTFDVEVPTERTWRSATDMGARASLYGPGHASGRRRMIDRRAAIADLAIRFDRKVILIEVELATRARNRIAQRLSGWAQFHHHPLPEDHELAGVLYICGDRLARSVASQVWQDRGSGAAEVRFADLAQVRAKVEEAWERRRRPWAGERGA